MDEVFVIAAAVAALFATRWPRTTCRGKVVDYTVVLIHVNGTDLAEVRRRAQRNVLEKVSALVEKGWEPGELSIATNKAVDGQWDIDIIHTLVSRTD